MREWIEQYVKSLVTRPEAVSVNESHGTMTVVFDIQVDSADQPIFEEKNQRLQRALTAVAGLAGVRERKRHVLKVNA